MLSRPIARVRRIAPAALPALIIFACALSAAYSLRLTFRFYHPALFADQWETILFFDRLLQGTITFGDFIAQHNEHRILFPRLVFVLDLWLTGARNGVNFAAILVCQAVHLALFHRMIALRVAEVWIRWALTALVAALLFGIVQWENFLWGFQIQFVGVFLFFTIAAFAFATAQERTAGEPRWHLVATGFCFGAGAALMMSNGAAALACIALVFAAARRFNRLTLAIALAAALLLVLYAATFTPNPGHTPLGFAARNPLLFVGYVAAYLGGMFAPLGFRPALLAGLIGLAASGLAGLALFTGRLARDRVNLTLVAILLFAGMTAAMTGMGRSSFGIAQALASRYATPSAIFWAALIVLAVSWLRAREPRQMQQTWPALVLLGAGALVSLMAIGLAQREFRFAGNLRVFDLQRANDALLSGVNDVPRIRTLYPDMNLVNNVMLPVLKARRLNVFAVPEPWPLDTLVPESRLVNDPVRCFGHIDGIAAVADTGAFEVSGWAWDAGARQPFRRLVVLSQERRVVGYGSSGQGRADVVARVPGVTSFFVGWAAYARVPGALTVAGQRLDGTLCRIGTIPSP